MSQSGAAPRVPATMEALYVMHSAGKAAKTAENRSAIAAQQAQQLLGGGFGCPPRRFVSKRYASTLVLRRRATGGLPAAGWPSHLRSSWTASLSSTPTAGPAVGADLARELDAVQKLFHRWDQGRHLSVLDDNTFSHYSGIFRPLRGLHPLQRRPAPPRRLLPVGSQAVGAGGPPVSALSGGDHVRRQLGQEDAAIEREARRILRAAWALCVDAELAGG